MPVRLSRTLAVLLVVIAALSALTAWRYLEYAQSLDVAPYDGGMLVVGLADGWGGVGDSMSVQVWSMTLIVLLLAAATALTLAQRRLAAALVVGLIALAVAVPLLSGLGLVFRTDTAMISAHNSLLAFRLAAVVSVGLSAGALGLAVRAWPTTGAGGDA